MEQKSEALLSSSATPNSDNLDNNKNKVTSDSPTKTVINKNLNFQEETKILVGDDYQAICSPFIPVNERKIEDISERALLLWIPTENITDAQLQTFITLAHEKYGYNAEQALAMLYWHKYDIKLAVDDLKKFIPFIDEWTPEDKKLFKDALLFHGKNFQRINEFLPHKTIGNLINHYYATKKKGRRLRSNKSRTDANAL